MDDKIARSEHKEQFSTAYLTYESGSNVITNEHWARNCARVTLEMSDYVRRFATPLTMSEEHGFGTAFGSGTYVQGTSLTWILTAEHVLSKVPAGGRLAHLPKDGQEYNAALGTPVVAPPPIDAAGLPIHPDPRFLPSSTRVVQQSSIAKKYSPVAEELLFWYGFPGYRLDRNDQLLDSKLWKSTFQDLSIPGKPMLTQAIANELHVSASNFNPALHAAVHYPAAATRALDGKMIALPKADGMSGSALWDTKFLACALEGKPWGPDMAEICGVVWGVFDNPDVVLVTKIEHVRAALPDVFT